MEGIETYCKTLGLGSFGMSALSAEIDVKDGRIVRTRGMHFDRAYSAEGFRPWTLEVRGKKLEGLLKNDIPPFALAYKKRAYSDNRILYPLKRVDWDPDGERNPGNRGKSKFERITWDEATDIIAKELRRIEKEYGYYAVFCQGDGHGETKTVHATHGCQMRLMSILGGFTFQARNPDSWEGLVLGRQARLGLRPGGRRRHRQPSSGHRRELALPAALGLRRGDHALGLVRTAAQPLVLLAHRGGRQADLRVPRRELRRCRARRQVDSREPQHRRGAAPGHSLHVDRERLVRPGVRGHARRGIRLGEVLRHGRRGRRSQDAQVGRGHLRRAFAAASRRWRRHGGKRPRPSRTVNGGSLIRRQFSAEPGRMEVVLMGMQGLGKPGRNVVKLIEWGLYGLPSQCPNPEATCT